MLNFFYRVKIIAIFMCRGNNEETLSENRGCRGGGKEGTEEKKKIVAKEEAESLMIFLITGARRSSKRKRLGNEIEDDGVTRMEERARRLLHLAACQPRIHLNLEARPSTTHVQPRRLRRRRRGGFSHKKY